MNDKWYWPVSEPVKPFQEIINSKGEPVVTYRPVLDLSDSHQGLDGVTYAAMAGMNIETRGEGRAGRQS